MATTLVDSATFEIKSGIVSATCQSGDETISVAFPLIVFRMVIAGGQRTLAEFDLNVGVTNIRGARALNKGRR